MKTNEFVIMTTYPHAILENMDASLDSSGTQGWILCYLVMFVRLIVQ